MEETRTKRIIENQSQLSSNNNINNNNPFRPTTPLMSTSQLKAQNNMDRSGVTPAELKSRPKVARTPNVHERINESNDNSIEE